jgi:HK97 family phage major capsid protein
MSTGRGGTTGAKGIRRGRSRTVDGLGQAFSKALALGTGSAGGVLVDEQTSAEIVTMIRARSAVMRLGVRVVPFDKELDVVSLSSGATATYVAENAPITPSEQTFAKGALLTEKELAALVPVSNRLLRAAASSPDVEQVIRADLAEVVALRQDLAFLEGPAGRSRSGSATRRA